MTTRRMASAFIGAALAAPFLSRRAASQALWAPSRPVRLVVAYPAGGATDAIARIVANHISTPLGQNVIVENVAGASGALGTRQVARAEPDGHTITFGNNQSHGTNMFLMRTPGYDAVKDFAALAGAGAFENVLVVRNDLPVKSIAEFVAYAKARPGELNFASTGPGSGSHLSAELFMIRTGTRLTHVPYRGLAAMAQDLVAGRMDFACAVLPSVVAQIQAGQVKALAMQSAGRNAMIPDVPTLSEQGVTNADLSSWTGFFAPATAPPASVERMSREIVAALGAPPVVEAIGRLGFAIEVRDARAFAAYQVSTMAVLADLIKTANIKPED
ncbi:MAG: tripartite tricarboxylate transporter substrate binding protein [Rhizobiales bacterium]|nr:tripartite tricarboxylate transporter substrate binding protein [Hyphomicrobiales bacterium]